ncbi:hypothetical protein FACS189421_02160 [Bacteroidia bacterium]|nr:hypothetical protein FACS189421_02160 [Bacteroidia bacterium]GHT49470.1 hypothetical protein FACS189440_15300 [Bacteroidia bacterium]
MRNTLSTILTIICLSYTSLAAQNSVELQGNIAGSTGLDLTEKHVITKVAYCPEYAGKRFQLGIFEGADTPDFEDAIPLLLIPEIPPVNRQTEKEVHCSRGFRYVRFVGPGDSHCKLSELKFFGYKGAGDDSQLYQITNLPTVSIHTKNAEDITI